MALNTATGVRWWKTSNRRLMPLAHTGCYPFFMPQFSVDLDVLRHALFDHSLSQVGDSLLEVKLQSPVRIDSLELSPNLGVRVLNRPEDKDAVVGTGDSSQIPFSMHSAWLKYTLSAKAEAKARIFAGSAEVVLSDYRRHSATESAWIAVTRDLEAPRTLLDLDHVRALRAGEALSMDVGGTLAANVTFPWSDVLGAKLLDIVGEVPVAVRLKTGLEVSASVRVSDHFSVVVSRTAEGRFRFAVRKAASQHHALGIDVALNFDIGARDIAEELLAQLPKVVREKIETDIVSKLEKAASWKAAVGFACEYARVDERTAIADFILLDDKKLAEDHARIVSGDMAAITKALRHEPQSRELVRYLNESTVTRRSSHGFSLGLGKWALSAKESSAFRISRRTSLDGFQLLTARGTRKYEEKNIPQNDFEWIVDLKAQMNEFALAPTTLDFDYGLHLLASFERRAISQGDLLRMADFASPWGVKPPDLDTFNDALGRKGSLRVQLLLERDDLTELLAGEIDIASFAGPLAMAMPYSSLFPERRTFEARLDTYGAAWEAWLRDAVTPPLPVRSGLAVVEKEGRVGSFAWTSGTGHPHLRENLAAFARGARLLQMLMTTAHPPETIGEAYDALSALFSQRLYVAALGRWLVERGARRATLQVEYDDVTITA
jgi:hypothetical protein